MVCMNFFAWFMLKSSRVCSASPISRIRFFLL